MQIKNFYNKLRYLLSWKFPRVYDVLTVWKFPLQLIFIGVCTMFAVSFYDKHFSFEASMRNSAQRSADSAAPVVKTASSQSHTTTEVIGKPQAIKVSSSQPTKTTLLKTEDALAAQVVKAEVLLREKKEQTARLEARVENAKNLLRESQQEISSASPAVDLYTRDWLQQQPEYHYVVQIAASTDPQFLKEFAKSKNIKPPLAIYPFKVDKEGELVYGLSSGLFIVKDDALTELPELEKISEEHGVWVRKVEEITTQLASLKRDQLVQ